VDHFIHLTDSGKEIGRERSHPRDPLRTPNVTRGTLRQGGPHVTPTEVAIRKIKITYRNIELVKRLEFYIHQLTSLQHQHLVPLLYTFRETSPENGDFLVLITPLAECSLRNIHDFPEILHTLSGSSIFQHLLSAISYLHDEAGIAHGGLNADKILIFYDLKVKMLQF
jgi:serine/threonine protein kinase